MLYRPLLHLILFAAFAAGCGGRTDGDLVFGGGGVADDASFDAAPDTPSFESPSFDAIAVDVSRHDAPTFDAPRPDGTSFDAIRVDAPGFETPPADVKSDVSSDVTVDAPIDTAIDAAIDSGVDAPFDSGGETGILCGGLAACDPGAQDCCVSPSSGSFACVPKGTCGGIPISCSSAASCPTGDVCCFGFGGGGATCTTSCGGIQLCALDAECAPLLRCRPAIAGFRVCQ